MNSITNVPFCINWDEKLKVGALNNDTALISTALQRGANINAEFLSQSDNYDTALHLAAKKGHVQAVILLIANKADLEAYNRWETHTPLYVTVAAIYKSIYKPSSYFINAEEIANRRECMRILIQNGASTSVISAVYASVIKSFSEYEEFSGVTTHAECLKIACAREKKCEVLLQEATSLYGDITKIIVSYWLEGRALLEKEHAENLKVFIPKNLVKI